MQRCVERAVRRVDKFWLSLQEKPDHCKILVIIYKRVEHHTELISRNPFNPNPPLQDIMQEVIPIFKNMVNCIRATMNQSVLLMLRLGFHFDLLVACFWLIENIGEWSFVGVRQWSF